MSTAAFFEPDKHYDYMIEFDRGGTDVVMYQYDDTEVRAMVKAAGARVGDGSFSDISYLGHLGIKGFNWGVGYRDYHGPRAHAFLDDTFAMVSRYLTFAEQNEGVYMPHDEPEDELGGYRGWWNDTPWADDWREICADDEPDWREICADDEDAPDWIEHPSLAQIDKIMAHNEAV